MASVLLVEDDAAVRQLIADALEARGLTVRSAGNDRQAYDVLEREAKSFRALVADINLGRGTTGYDVARRARRLNPDLAVIYITGQAAHLDRFGVGGAVMFPKPFRVDELVEQVVGLADDARRAGD